MVVRPELSSRFQPKVLDEGCDELRKSRDALYRTHLFYLAGEFPPIERNGAEDSDVTWLAQLSFDRLHMVELLCHYWPGISFSYSMFW